MTTSGECVAVIDVGVEVSVHHQNTTVCDDREGFTCMTYLGAVVVVGAVARDNGGNQGARRARRRREGER